ncbi:MAG: hypothetical protein QM485_05295 [Flavobacteriaceae bacterium]
MKNRIEKNIVKAGLLFLAANMVSYAQDVTTVEALSEEISENLNLEAVASIFGDSKDLEDFENKLNDPEVQISNLDLDQDGSVDYLRVVETTESDTHLIVVQAVLGEDIYQDVATIEVEKDDTGQTRVQIVGDVYVYGTAFIIEPIYVHRPLLFSLFWSSNYTPYHSVYYWGVYPHHFHFWKPLSVFGYKKHVHTHGYIKHTYHYPHVRHSSKALYLHTKITRNDFGKKWPNKSHAVRTARINGAHGSPYKTVRANKVGRSTKRGISVHTVNGTRKGKTLIRKPNRSRAVVTVKRSPNRFKQAVVIKKNPKGSRKVKVSHRKSSSTRKKKV